MKLDIGKILELSEDSNLLSMNLFWVQQSLIARGYKLSDFPEIPNKGFFPEYQNPDSFEIEVKPGFDTSDILEIIHQVVKTPNINKNHGYRVSVEKNIAGGNNPVRFQSEEEFRDFKISKISETSEQKPKEFVFGSISITKYYPIAIVDDKNESIYDIEENLNKILNETPEILDELGVKVSEVEISVDIDDRSDLDHLTGDLYQIRGYPESTIPEIVRFQNTN